jgi:hypothetical protein
MSVKVTKLRAPATIGVRVMVISVHTGYLFTPGSNLSYAHSKRLTNLRNISKGEIATEHQKFDEQSLARLQTVKFSHTGFTGKVERSVFSVFARDCIRQRSFVIGIDAGFYARARDCDVIDVLGRRRAECRGLDQDPVRREPLRAMDGRSIGMIEMQRPLGRKLDAPPVGFEGDFIRSDGCDLEAFAIGEAKRGAVSCDADNVADR